MARRRHLIRPAPKDDDSDKGGLEPQAARGLARARLVRAPGGGVRRQPRPAQRHAHQRRRDADVRCGHADARARRHAAARVRQGCVSRRHRRRSRQRRQLRSVLAVRRHAAGAARRARVARRRAAPGHAPTTRTLVVAIDGATITFTPRRHRRRSRRGRRRARSTSRTCGSRRDADAHEGFYGLGEWPDVVDHRGTAAADADRARHERRGRRQREPRAGAAADRHARLGHVRREPAAGRVRCRARERYARSTSTYGTDWRWPRVPSVHGGRAARRAAAATTTSPAIPGCPRRGRSAR